MVHKLADCLLWQQEVGQALAAMQHSGDLTLQARNEELERQIQNSIRVQQVLVSCIEEVSDEVSTVLKGVIDSLKPSTVSVKL